MPPLAEPPAGILKSLRETAEVIRHRFPGPEALEDLQRGYRQLAKMPVNNPHVGDPGVQSGKVVLYGPWALASATEFSIRSLETVTDARS
jgi:hypothetical protein